MSYATAGNSNEIDYTTRAKHYTNNTIEAFNKKLSIITAQTDIGKNASNSPYHET